MKKENEIDNKRSIKRRLRFMEDENDKKIKNINKKI